MTRLLCSVPYVAAALLPLTVRARKAYTALWYRTPSGEYGKRATSNPQSVGVLHLDKITTADGDLPIRAGNEQIGAIGVYGSPRGDKDAVCAQAGIDHIARSLGGSP